MNMFSFRSSHRRCSVRPGTLLKRDSNTGVFCKICEIFKNADFEEYLRTWNYKNMNNMQPYNLFIWANQLAGGLYLKKLKYFEVV